MSGELTPRPEEDEAGLLPGNSQQQAEGEQCCAGSCSTLTILQLPDDVMLEIFSYLSTTEIINTVQKVCTRWEDLTHYPCLWYRREYVIRQVISEEEARRVFEAMPYLRILKLQFCVPPYVLEALSEYCHHLVSLEAEEIEMIGYAVSRRLFNGCNNIRILKISETMVQDDETFLDAVTRLPHLEVLHLLRGPRYWGRNRRHINLQRLTDNCPRLRELHLGNVTYTIEDAKHFINSKKRKLVRLGIRWTAMGGRNSKPQLFIIRNTQTNDIAIAST